MPLQYAESQNSVQVIQSMTILVRFKSRQQIDYSTKKANNFSDLGFINKKHISHYSQPLKQTISKKTSYPAGEWIKLAVRETGIYQIGFSSMAEKIDLDNGVDLDRIALYSNSGSGQKLNSSLAAEIPANLMQNSIHIAGNNDTKFNSGDTLYFYGQSTSRYFLNGYGNYDYTKNPYSDENYYWLLIADQTLESPARVTTLSANSRTAEYTQTTTQAYFHFENDNYNILQSGDEWFGKQFESSGDSKTIIPPFRNINISENEALNENRDITAKIRFAGGSGSGSNFFSIYFNNELIKNKSISGYNRETVYLSYYDLRDYIYTQGGNSFRILNNTNNRKAYFDYLEMICHTDNIYNGDDFILTGDKFSGNIEYRISNNSNQNPIIFNITNPQNLFIQEYNKENGELIFTSPNNKSKRQRYLITGQENYKEPISLEHIANCQWDKIRNQSITADYIIITAGKFRNAAQKIKSIYEEQVPTQDRLKVLITEQDQIFREFNGDVRDPNAIRYFLQYAFQNWQVTPSYVLLLGDGTYDHRGLEQKYAEENYIMTYQQAESSWRDYKYFPNDAFYTYVNGEDRRMDLAIGRIPARSAEEALAYADKLEGYLVNPNYGEWRNQITLVADDPNRPHPNEVEHIRDSESALAANIPHAFNLAKLYALEFPAEENASSYGVGRPAATAAIIERLNKGTNIITYLGHGSPNHWAQEGLLEKNDLGKIQNSEKYPIWLVGTCSWSYYDFIDKYCIPEKLILAEESGAIATFGGPRPSWATSNASLMRKILTSWFADHRINRIRIGEVIRSIKNGNSNNDEQYTLLGDPAFFPAFPYHNASFTKLSKDTLQSLDHTQVSGKVEELDNFSGQGILKVFDSEQLVNRKDTEGNIIKYVLPGNIIYKGQVEIRKGNFGTKFTIPKDVNFGERPGYFNLYAWNSETGEEVAGYYDNVYYSGSKNINDTTGPEIDLEFTGLDFRENDIVTPENDIKIILTDENGINITNQLGHEIALKFDENSEKINVTEYFTATSEDSGEVIYPLPADLEAGLHRVTIQAWDNANNISMTTKEFDLATTSDLELQKVVNYPNPFASTTDFTFYLTQPAEINIAIYTIRGLLIKELDSQTILPAGFNTINWNGRDDFGDNISRGIYLYKVSAKAEASDNSADYIGKMVKE